LAAVASAPRVLVSSHGGGGVHLSQPPAGIHPPPAIAGARNPPAAAVQRRANMRRTVCAGAGLRAAAVGERAVLVARALEPLPPALPPPSRGV
jgi:hypothetical protein